MAEKIIEAARQWADELGWLFSDEKFKPYTVAQMHPDDIRDGVRFVRQLIEECERIEKENPTD